MSSAAGVTAAGVIAADDVTAANVTVIHLITRIVTATEVTTADENDFSPGSCLTR